MLYLNRSSEEQAALRTALTSDAFLNALFGSIEAASQDVVNYLAPVEDGRSPDAIKTRARYDLLRLLAEFLSQTNPPPDVLLTKPYVEQWLANHFGDDAALNSPSTIILEMFESAAIEQLRHTIYPALDKATMKLARNLTDPEKHPEPELIAFCRSWLLGLLH